jgi:fumarate hydratase class II
MKTRTEHDSMGEIQVPVDRYWGAQTQRSKQNFPIGVGHETMPEEIISAFAHLKSATAQANRAFKPKMTEEKEKAIVQACNDILNGKLEGNFPLVVWQTGSGTQTNMNVNEVVANRGNEIAGTKLLHPNDDVNMSQSSNDTFPTALHIATTKLVVQKVLPSLDVLIAAFGKLEKENEGILKCGRTHLMDATPVTFAQEISGWRASLEQDRKLIENNVPQLAQLAIGGTAVGTGLNAPKGFDKAVSDILTKDIGIQFTPAPNKFHALTSHGEITAMHGALKALAADLMKIANDIRWLASGPRNGLGEIFIPANEPGSSIMPGKVNPTQCEAMTMVAVQVMGNDTAIGIAASQGNFELNVYQPVTAYNFIQSARLLSDVMLAFTEHCVSGIKPNKAKMDHDLHASLMLVTAISPIIGYENAAKTAHLALEENLTLRQACTKLGFMTPDEFDAAFKPEKMV